MPRDALETAPTEDLQAYAALKLRELLSYAQTNSPYYRKAFAGLPPDAELAALPILDKATLVANSPPARTELLTGPLESAYVFRSGGTTGNPTFSPFSVGEFRRWTQLFIRTYHAAGLRSSDRVANLFVGGSLYASFLFVNHMLEEMGCLNFPFTASTPPEAIARHMELFPINTLMGIPSWILQVVEELPDRLCGQIEKVFYAGEHLYPEEREYLSRRLGLKVLASGGYGAVDVGLMGYQCERAQGSVHHILADHTLLEFVDPESLRPVESGEPGLILVTALDRTLMPLIRYRIGDVGRMVPEPCPCGRTMPRFELLGRGDEILRIGIANVSYDEVMQAVATVPGLSTHMQLIKEREGHRDRLVVLVEQREPGDEATMRSDLEEALYRLKPDVRKLVEAGHIHPLDLRVLPLGGIPRVPVTGKIKRTVDRSIEPSPHPNPHHGSQASMPSAESAPPAQVPHGGEGALRTPSPTIVGEGWDGGRREGTL